MKKILVSIMAIMMLVGVLAVGAYATDATVATLERNGETIGSYITITEAITKADNGDVILVADGTYSDNITIDKAVTIKGAGEELTTLTGSVNITTTTDTGAATLEDLTVDNAGYYHVNLTGTTDVDTGNSSVVAIIKNVTIEAESTNANHISIFAGSAYGGHEVTYDVTVENVTFVNTGDDAKAYHSIGINSECSSSAIQTGCSLKVTGCTFDKAAWSIFNLKADNIEITGNTFNNTAAGVQLYAYEGSNVDISGNKFNGAGGNGIVANINVADSETLNITGNTLNGTNIVVSVNVASETPCDLYSGNEFSGNTESNVIASLWAQSKTSPVVVSVLTEDKLATMLENFPNAKIHVSGNIELTESLTVAEGQTLVVDEGADLSIAEGGSFTNNGTLEGAVASVAKIAYTEYGTLEEALAAAKDGDIIVITSDLTVSEDVRLPAVENITLRADEGVEVIFNGALKTQHEPWKNESDVLTAYNSIFLQGLTINGGFSMEKNWFETVKISDCVFNLGYNTEAVDKDGNPTNAYYFGIVSSGFMKSTGYSDDYCQVSYFIFEGNEINTNEGVEDIRALMLPNVVEAYIKENFFNNTTGTSIETSSAMTNLEINGNTFAGAPVLVSEAVGTKVEITGNTFAKSADEDAVDYGVYMNSGYEYDKTTTPWTIKYDTPKGTFGEVKVSENEQGDLGAVIYKGMSFEATTDAIADSSVVILSGYSSSNASGTYNKNAASELVGTAYENLYRSEYVGNLNDILANNENVLIPAGTDIVIFAEETITIPADTTLTIDGSLTVDETGVIAAATGAKVINNTDNAITITYNGKEVSVSANSEYPKPAPVVTTPSYMVTVKASEGGKVSPTSITLVSGSSREFTFTADEGYVIADVLVNGESVGAVTSYTLKVTAATTIEAIFELEEKVIENPFIDVDEGHWFNGEVLKAYDQGLMTGVTETEFAPYAETSRAMIMTVLHRLSGDTTYTGDDSAWYANAMNWAVAMGISDGTAPDASITREQIATMLYRYAVLMEMDTTAGENTNILSYVDFAEISEYAIEAIQYVCGVKVMQGDEGGNLNPQGNATRAETAAMLARFAELVK